MLLSSETFVHFYSEKFGLPLCGRSMGVAKLAHGKDKEAIHKAQFTKVRQMSEILFFNCDLILIVSRTATCFFLIS